MPASNRSLRRSLLLAVALAPMLLFGCGGRPETPPLTDAEARQLERDLQAVEDLERRGGHPAP